MHLSCGAPPASVWHGLEDGVYLHIACLAIRQNHLLIFPDPQADIRQTRDGVVTDESYIALITERLQTMRLAATGSSNRIERAMVLADPPSVKHAEITAKGSLNINAILRHRKKWLDRLYTGTDPDCINLKGRE